MTISDFTERELVARIQQHLPPPPAWLLVGIGDDAAVVEPERNRLEVLSVDAIVEGVHFDRRFTPPEAIGHRALAVNLSDLAAMGAEPRLALLSLALPPALTCDELERMAAGLAALAARHRVHVAGGNLTRSPGPLMIDVTVVGTVKRRHVLTRGGARPGDDVYVSGTIGAAAAGLHLLQAGLKLAATEDTVGTALAVVESAVEETCIARYLYPEARVRLGLLLGRNRAASACIDLSDGLADGVRQIAHASAVGVILDAATIPVDPAARAVFEARTPRASDAIDTALAGGDDYELLFAVRPRTTGRLRAARRHGGVQLTRIGVCTANPEVILQSGGGTRALPRGYGHFR